MQSRFTKELLNREEQIAIIALDARALVEWKFNGTSKVMENSNAGVAVIIFS